MAGPHLCGEVIPVPTNWNNTYPGEGGYYGRVDTLAFMRAYKPAVVAGQKELELMSHEYDQLKAQMDRMERTLGIVRGGIFDRFSYSGKPGTLERGVIHLLKDINRNTWNTKKMVRYLFNMLRIGTPGVISDGRLGGKMRKLLSYKKAEDGQARRTEWEADAKRNYDFN
ncbi:hypothetical protein NBM05_03905 [Rothia sp. AR01]|uniref:Uncharacterized protein n=1 Tax=Rothia santali TaxID=2949643 RepID=A0A9X2HE87_9MICC|nr:hypothetical protein [Rothia santali]MCP3425192.1 hypothetical protein [Rothia santali]